MLFNSLQIKGLWTKGLASVFPLLPEERDHWINFLVRFPGNREWWFVSTISLTTLLPVKWPIGQTLPGLGELWIFDGVPFMGFPKCGDTSDFRNPRSDAYGVSTRDTWLLKSMRPFKPEWTLRHPMQVVLLGTWAVCSVVAAKAPVEEEHLWILQGRSTYSS